MHSPGVVLEEELSSEGGAADVALEGLFPGVQNDVPLEVRGPPEPPVAVRTNVLPLLVLGLVHFYLPALALQRLGAMQRHASGSTRVGRSKRGHIS